MLFGGWWWYLFIIELNLDMVFFRICNFFVILFMNEEYVILEGGGVFGLDGIFCLVILVWIMFFNICV